ncbi:MAG: hypothetical protein QOK20_1359 [Acidimicrobiaceae bacterium]|nr:hypothetical protein [Acidimicrobiaceae bacterium]
MKRRRLAQIGHTECPDGTDCLDGSDWDDSGSVGRYGRGMGHCRGAPEHEGDQHRGRQGPPYEMASRTAEPTVNAHPYLQCDAEHELRHNCVRGARVRQEFLSAAWRAATFAARST